MDIDAIFFWFRVALIVILIGYLFFRYYAQRSRKNPLQVLDSKAIKKEEEFERHQEDKMVKGLLGNKPPLEEGDIIPPRRPTVKRPAVKPVRVDPVEDEKPDLGMPSSSAPKQLPEPEPGRCHLIIENEDATWVNIRVGGSDKEIAMIGQKETSITVRRGVLVIEFIPRNDKNHTRISISGQHNYCFVELEGGTVKQCRNEKGPLAFELLR